jgi:carbohydrate-selective porin OprB
MMGTQIGKGISAMSRLLTITVALFLLGNSLQWQVEAQDAPPANPYSGDIWTRSTLTGDWGGIRNQLADKGVTLDLSITQIASCNLTGANRANGEFF